MSDQDTIFPGIDDLLPDRECDVVMKGGITSGVIYPLAICQLATRFRLVNVGGTSAGAIAAAAAAAAELGRRRRHQGPGFETAGFSRLTTLPNELGSGLRTLFQAADRTRALLRLMMAATRARTRPAREGQPAERGKTIGGKVLPILAATLAVRPFRFGAGLAVPVAVTAAALWFGGPVGGAVVVVALVLATLVGTILGLALAAMSLYRVLAREVPKNHFGICTGMGDESALTPWLSELLDAVSGNNRLPERERHPLTFGDLWGEQAVARHRELDTQRRPTRIDEWATAQQLRLINLEMMTTDLSNGRPYRLPTRARGLSFCPIAMRELFPEAVVAHMVATSLPTRRTVDGKTEPVTCPDPSHQREPLYYLPRMPDLPVVVATRMSLSFPLLMSAVPLYRVDYRQTGAPVVPCWFSDGGIISNFPIHFFDGILPRRPTFGMNLRTRVPDRPDEDVYLPPSIGQSERTRWRPITTIAGFGAMIMDTMQNWSDEAQMTVPGFRDRIVHVALYPTEGGMNLDMPPDLIRTLAGRGRTAAELLTGAAPTSTMGFDWDQHRWTRYRTAMAKLEQALESLIEAYDDHGDAGYAHFLQQFRPRHYVGSDAQLWLSFNQDSVDRLLELCRAWQRRPRRYADYAPEPDPELRIVPRF